MIGVTHELPPDHVGVTPCCRRPVRDLPDGDYLTDDPDLVTCKDDSEATG